MIYLKGLRNTLMVCCFCDCLKICKWDAFLCWWAYVDKTCLELMFSIKELVSPRLNPKEKAEAKQMIVLISLFVLNTLNYTNFRSVYKVTFYYVCFMNRYTFAMNMITISPYTLINSAPMHLIPLLTKCFSIIISI